MIGQHERAEHQEHRRQPARVVLVGGQHPVDRLIAIAAAARGHQQEITVDEAARVGIGGAAADLTPQIPGINHAPAHARRQLEAGQRVADLRQAVDPDLVVIFAQRRHRVLALPLGFERAWIVHHIAQPEDERRAARPQEVERRPHLAAQAQRFLVDNQQVGGTARFTYCAPWRIMIFFALTYFQRHFLCGYDLFSDRIFTRVVDAAHLCNPRAATLGAHCQLANDHNLWAGVRGRENIPQGPLLVVGKHRSGTLLYHHCLMIHAWWRKRNCFTSPFMVGLTLTNSR